MRNVELQERTKKFALRVIKMVGALPGNMTADVLGRQTLRSGTSVAANYREACRARSKAEMISKLAQVEQEIGRDASLAGTAGRVSDCPSATHERTTAGDRRIAPNCGGLDQNPEGQARAVIPHSPFPIPHLFH